MKARRKFIKKLSLATLSTMVGADIVYAASMPEGYLPLLLEPQDPYKRYNKHPEMVLLNDRPLNMEAAAHLLDHEVTPADRMFVRCNGLIPQEINEKEWRLEITGESVVKNKVYTLDELKSKFKKYSYQLTLECAGNGRSEFNPPASGNQWTLGAVSCARWSGLRLRDLLEDVGIDDTAVYIGYYGSDKHLSGDPGKSPISRGIPLSKALQDETLLAYEMNGEPIPVAHGFPLRLVAGGYPASASGKWVNKLVVRNKVHDGVKMTGKAYRIPCEPVAPGAEVEDDNMCIIESMPVKSLITYPKSGGILQSGDELEIRGHAWAGELEVSAVDISIDFGASWQSCEVKKPVNRLAWQHFSKRIKFPSRGYYEVWARATNEEGKQQPMVLPGWNPKGYLNNACHRIAIKVV